MSWGSVPRRFAPASFRSTVLPGGTHAVSTDRSMQQRTAEIARQIRAEDGVGRFLQLFQEYVARFRPGRAGTAPCESCNSGS